MASAMDTDPVNVIHLDSLTESTIHAVNLYPHSAQITRRYKFYVTQGELKIMITRLTNVLDYESLRVEGRGPATIHDVATWRAEMDTEEVSPTWTALQDKKKIIKNAIARSNKAAGSIDDYMSKIEVQHLDISKLGDAMDVYDSVQEKWDSKLIQLEKELEDIKAAEEAEESKKDQDKQNLKLRTRVNVRLHAQDTAEYELYLIYAVSHCGWDAGYDIRVDMQQPDQPVRVVYKALVKQSTSELWENVPITLHTNTPSSDVEIPRLETWRISLGDPAKRPGSGGVGTGLGRGGAKRHRRILPDEDDLEFDGEYTQATVTSKGHINATFRIPGAMTVPYDGEAHKVTIVDLDLLATMSWVCVPKGDTRMHLKATIKNSSQYTFLPGVSHVYVDGSYIAASDVPSVVPQEVFECPLGLDPTIRVTYHPRSTLASESGFYNKTKIQSFTQRITIQNTKTVAVDGVKIIDHIPVSENAQLLVNLISPALVLPSAGTVSKVSSPAKVAVADNILAQWHGVDDAKRDAQSLGSDGKLEWVCKLAALETVKLVLQWEVTTPVKGEEVWGL